MPAGDGALFLNTRCEFHFVEAVRNLRRIDRTFVTTALARHASGVALTTLPPNLADLREVATASCAALLNRLRAFFDHQIVDLGELAPDQIHTPGVYVQRIVQRPSEPTTSWEQSS